MGGEDGVVAMLRSGVPREVSFRLRSRTSIPGHPFVRRLLWQVIREVILPHNRSRRSDHVKLSSYTWFKVFGA